MGDIEVEVEVSWWKPGAHSIIPARMSLRHDLSSSKTLCRAAVPCRYIKQTNSPPPSTSTHILVHTRGLRHLEETLIQTRQTIYLWCHLIILALVYLKQRLYMAKSGNPLIVQLTVGLVRRVFRKDGRDPKRMCLTWLRNKSCKGFPPKALQPPRPFSKLKSQGSFSFIYRWGLQWWMKNMI